MRLPDPSDGRQGRHRGHQRAQGTGRGRQGLGILALDLEGVQDPACLRVAARLPGLAPRCTAPLLGGPAAMYSAFLSLGLLICKVGFITVPEISED